MSSELLPVGYRYRNHLHRMVDNAIDRHAGNVQVEITMGIESTPNHQTGWMENRYNGEVTIRVTPTSTIMEAEAMQI